MKSTGVAVAKRFEVDDQLPPPRGFKRSSDGELSTMSERKLLSDAEIADVLGNAPPIQPLDPMPDPNAVLQERFLGSVENWLIRKVSLADVQSQLLTPETLPSFRSDFEEFAIAATESHKLWEFCSPQSDWDRMAGRSGFALVKDGRVTNVIVTIVS